MKSYGKLGIALLIIVATLTPLVASMDLISGPSAQVKNSDSVSGVYTTTNAQIFATGAIQAAVDAAKPGATIFLWPKRYYDNVDVNKNLKIIGSGALLTTVDGQKLGSVFTIDYGVTATLSDMTIQNGQASNGGGVDDLGTVTLRRCEITGNTAYNYGGGVWDDFNGILTVDSCNIHNNHANVLGGGIISAGGSTLNVKDSTFSFNTADENGGAISNGGTVTLKNTIFIGNTAAAAGAIYNYLTGTTTADRCTFMGNKAIGSGVGSYGELYGHGGAVYNMGTMGITNSVFTYNFASAINGGGAIYNTGALTRSGDYFVSNSPNNIAP